jgi:spore coat polysaccharide biosynthesis protein SpsF (cytidylyltransferase family)
VNALKKAYDLAQNSSFSEYMTYYFVNYPQVFKLNIIQAKRGIARPNYRLTVDYPEDYEVMKRIFGHFANTPGFSLTEAIEFLDVHPEIVRINSDKTAAPLDPSVNTRLNIA